MVGKGGVGEERWALQKKFPASLFPQLCKGLIKDVWCLEQSTGKWDSTNSTGSAGRQARPATTEPSCPRCTPYPAPTTRPPILILHPSHPDLRPRLPTCSSGLRQRPLSPRPSRQLGSLAAALFTRFPGRPLPSFNLSITFLLIQNDSHIYLERKRNPSLVALCLVLKPLLTLMSLASPRR